MHTLQLKTNEHVMVKIMNFIDTLSRQGDEIEVLDNKTLAYEKRLIDRSLKDIEEGNTYSIEEVEQLLLND